jgi:hypothetical protein
MNHKWICAHDVGVVVLAKNLDIFILGAIATGETTTPSHNLFFAKITLVGWMSGS